MSKSAYIHPEIGYFESVGTGVVMPGSVPVAPRPAPHWNWDGAGWIEGDKPEEPAPSLSPARFEWLLAYTGLDEVWQALETALKVADRGQYAMIRAQRSKSQFDLETTVKMVGTFRTVAAQVAPDADLSDAAIRAAWALAAEAAI